MAIVRHADNFIVCRYILERFTMVGDGVVDAFAGVGTMTQAASEEGRHCLAIEEDKPIYEGLLAPMHTFQ